MKDGEGASRTYMRASKEYSVRIVKDLYIEGLWHWIVVSHRQSEVFGMGQEHTEREARQGAMECIRRPRQIA